MICYFRPVCVHTVCSIPDPINQHSYLCDIAVATKVSMITFVQHEHAWLAEDGLLPAQGHGGVQEQGQEETGQARQDKEVGYI